MGSISGAPAASTLPCSNSAFGHGPNMRRTCDSDNPSGRGICWSDYFSLMIVCGCARSATFFSRNCLRFSHLGILDRDLSAIKLRLDLASRGVNALIGWQDGKEPPSTPKHGSQSRFRDDLERGWWTAPPCRAPSSPARGEAPPDVPGWDSEAGGCLA